MGTLLWALKYPRVTIDVYNFHFKQIIQNVQVWFLPIKIWFHTPGLINIKSSNVLWKNYEYTITIELSLFWV